MRALDCHSHTQQETAPIGELPTGSRATLLPWLIARPSLEYQHAFDLCAAYALATGGPIAIIAHNDSDVADLLERCVTLTVQVGLVNFAPLDVNNEVTSRVQQFRTLIWITSSDRNFSKTAEYLRQHLTNDGKLLVLCAGSLAFFLKGRVSKSVRRGHTSESIVRQSLKKLGFQIEAQWGFHGPSSLFLGSLGLLLSKLKRDELADRCHFYMRAAYVSKGRKAAFAPLLLLVARQREQL